MTNEHETVSALIREDLLAHIEKVFETLNGGTKLLHNWHIDAIVHALTESFLGGTNHLIINMPPRYLKSLCVSIAFPTWIMGRKPHLRIICASYADDLATSFSRDRRKVIESKWYKDAFPKMRIGRDKNTEREIETSKGGKCIATSVRGGITGKGGDVLIWDDLLKIGDAASESEREYVNHWFRSSFYTRLNDKEKGLIVGVMQRVHQDDLVGHILAFDKPRILSLPAIASEDQSIPIGNGEYHERKEGDVLHPERESHEQLMKIREMLGGNEFNAQYLQAPIPPGGYVFQREWFKRIIGPIDRNLYGQIYQSWDTAAETSSGASYSVCITFGLIEGRAHIIHVLRKRLIYPDLRATVERHARHWGASKVLVEKASTGIPLLHDLAGRQGLNLIPIKPEGPKINRAEWVTGVIEAGRIYLPEEASWLPVFEDEIFTFPQCKHSDQVDALSQFIRYWDESAPPVLNINVVIPRRTNYYDRMGGSFPF
jgi:predicted phage terminase large subunit-like protein